MFESCLIAFCAFGTQVFSVAFLLSVILTDAEVYKHNPTLCFALSALFLLLPLLAYPRVLNGFSWNVHMDDTNVWMKGDKLAAKWFRVQSFVEVPFSKVVSITIEHSSKNSSGQSIVTRMYGPIWSKKRYLVFETTSKKRKRINVSHFTEATLAEIIDEIANRCETNKGPYDGRRASEILFGLQVL